MINNLDEAIKHAKEKAEELNAHADYYRNHDMPEYLPSCLECAKEHEQLAEWLTELKNLREENEILKAQLETFENTLDDAITEPPFIIP